MTYSRPHAIRTGIPAADHHHVLAPGVDPFLGRQVDALQHPVLHAEQFQGEMHPRQFPSRHRQVARHFSTDGQAHRIVFADERLHREVFSHGRARS